HIQRSQRKRMRGFAKYAYQKNAYVGVLLDGSWCQVVTVPCGTTCNSSSCQPKVLRNNNSSTIYESLQRTAPAMMLLYSGNSSLGIRHSRACLSTCASHGSTKASDTMSKGPTS